MKRATASSLVGSTALQTRMDTVAKERIDVLELLRKRGMDGDVDFLREALRVLVGGIMDAEVSAQTSAGHGERTPGGITHRKGYRTRSWDTRVDTLDLHIPKLREGSHFPTPCWSRGVAVSALCLP